MSPALKGFDDLPPLDLSNLSKADVEALLGKVDTEKIKALVADLKKAQEAATSDREILATVLAAAQVAIKLLA